MRYLMKKQLSMALTPLAKLDVRGDSDIGIARGDQIAESESP
jgi:hypothetical protein